MLNRPVKQSHISIAPIIDLNYPLQIFRLAIGDPGCLIPFHYS